MNFRIATFVLSIILICMISFKAIKKNTIYTLSLCHTFYRKPFLRCWWLR